MYCEECQCFILGGLTRKLDHRVVKLVRALRKGWIKRSSERHAPVKAPEAYLLWADDGMATDRTATGLSYVPAPKTKLPGHEESYNPPKEYLPSEVRIYTKSQC